MRIMVATDGSRGSTAALNFAARLASEERGSELVVLTVASSNGASHPAGTSNGGSDPRGVAQKVLDLVVVGSEGRDTLSEWVLGGTALRLIYVARRPVTVVRPPRRRKAS